MKKVLIIIAVFFSSNIFALQIGDKTPNFNAATTKGDLDFYNWSGDSWVILFSHPGDFTPVCTTELAQAALLQPEFTAKNVKLIALSIDSVEDHLEWIPHINEFKNQIKQELSLEKSLDKVTEIFSKKPDLEYPIIADTSLEIAKIFDMIHPNANPNESSFGVSHKATVRSVFFIDPNKKVQSILTYPMQIGRNFEEILRTLDALQIADKYKVSTPANWNDGDDVIVPTYITNDMIEEKYGTEKFIQHQDYLRMIKQPGYYSGNENRNKKKNYRK